MQRLIILFLAVLMIGSCVSEEAQKDENQYFQLVRPIFDGQQAFEIVDYMEDYWRLAGNKGFNLSVDKIVDNLEAAGYINENIANKNDPLTYRIETRPMKRLTWEPITASLQINGQEEPILSFPDNFNMIDVNSWSTPAQGITAEIIKVDADKYDRSDVSGKIVFAEGSPYQHYKKAIVEGGAVGLITYGNPAYLQPDKNITSIQFRSIPQDTVRKAWGIALSYQAKEILNKELAKGKVIATVSIQTELYPSEELTVIAQAHGNKHANEELVFSAHIQEPGANDNASGVGAQTEMARVTAALIQTNQLDLDRTITFLFGDEIISTRRYVEADTLGKIKWGISLDMVGEDTEKTGGSFLIEKMPDPAAVWLRGNDKHTEWGGKALPLERVVPHYFNDFMIDVFEQQGEYASWTVSSNPFEGGSDHVPFLRKNIPGILLWHFTDQFYHSSNDRIDKVSANTLENVGVGALAAGYYLANLDEESAIEILGTLKIRATARLDVEFQLSKQEMAENNELERQQQILQSWVDYYAGASQALKENLPASSTKFEAARVNFEEAIHAIGTGYIEELKKMAGGT